MILGRGAAVLVLAVLGLVLLPAAPAAATSTADRVVVVGIPGLRWDHLDPQTTPELWELAGDSAIGSLSVRAARSLTCAADGWVTIGAGNRARGPAHPSGECPAGDVMRTPVVDGDGATTPDLRAIADDNDDLTFNSRVGGLGSAVARGGGCVGAVGPGAAYAAADRSGRVASYDRGVRSLDETCAVTIVELPTVLPDGPRDVRLAALAEIDSRLAQLRGQLDQDTLLIVVGPSEFEGPAVPRLHVAMAHGPGYEAGTLTSPSTRRAPFVQLIDVAPTVLRVLDLDVPSWMSGQRWRVAEPATGTTQQRIDALIDADIAAQAHRRLVPPFFAILVGSQILLYGGGALLLHRLRKDGRNTGPEGRRVRRALSRVALAFAAAPVATYLVNLVPWWRLDHLLLTLLGVVAIAVAAVSGIALAGPWRRHPLGPVGAVAGITAGVLAVDLMTGATLQLSSLAGYSPLVAGRFAGIGNVAFAVFAASAILFAAALVHRRGPRTTLAVAALVGSCAVIIDGAPTFGSDFGGVLALVPGFAVFGMLAAGIRVSFLRLLLIGVIAVVAVATFATIDYLRPEEARSHLGRFVAQIVDGEAWTIIQRKAEANLRLLRHSVLTLLVPVATLFVTGVLLKPWGGLRKAFEQAPAFRAGLLGVLTMGIVGFLVNDSGVAIPALAMTVAVPIALSVSMSAVDRDTPSTTAA